MAPSLRVAHQAAANVYQCTQEKAGHVVVVGNPLPTPKGFQTLPFAEKEAEAVEDTLNRANITVQQQHFFRSWLLGRRAWRIHRPWYRALVPSCSGAHPPAVLELCALQCRRDVRLEQSRLPLPTKSSASTRNACLSLQ